MIRKWPWERVITAWGIAAVFLLIASADAIRGLDFADPDDAMRLVEVRDWLAGQSWWDVGQHRLGGGSFAMHWSRLVDIPLALTIRLFAPLVGNEAATQIAVTAIPLLGLLAIIALATELARRLGDDRGAGFVPILAPLSLAILYQLRPVRIDHHGWQMICALAAVTALFGRPSMRTGVLAGISLACLLTISLEGMPIALAIAAVAVLGWVFDDGRRTQALACIWSLSLGTALLHVMTRGPAMFAPACDAIAPAWIAAITVGALGATVTMWMSGKQVPVRFVMLGGAAVAAVAALRALAPQCFHGPFATLDPLVYRLWYLNIDEGLPIWQQKPSVASIYLCVPIAGIIGYVLAIRTAGGAARLHWMMMAGVATASLLIAVLVARAGAIANVMALPGTAWLFGFLLDRARRVRSPLGRSVAAGGALLAAAPGVAVILSVTFAPHAPANAAMGKHRPGCASPSDVAALDQLPPTTLFTPLDITPELLVDTRHRAIAAGYHRNSAAMHRVLAAFTGSPQQARRIILASGARYVAVCPGFKELDQFETAAPNGFWAQLDRGRSFSWLQPVALHDSPVLVWRVVDRD